MYFIIRDSFIEMVDDAGLEKFLNGDDNGDDGEIHDRDEPPQFRSSIAQGGESLEWPGNSILIIKGEIVTPKPKEFVTRYVIE